MSARADRWDKRARARDRAVRRYRLSWWADGELESLDVFGDQDDVDRAVNGLQVDYVRGVPVP